MEHSNSNNAIALLRVSSQKQGIGGDGPKQQLEACEFKAGKDGRIITKSFEHVESGAKRLEEQPSWKAVRYCETHPEIKYCYVKDISRFTRGGARAFIPLWDALLELNVELIDTEGNVDDKVVNTLEEKNISYSWSKVRPSRRKAIDKAEEYRENREKLLQLMIGAEVQYARQGYKVGVAQYGYKNIKAPTEHGIRTIMVPNEEEAVYVRRMFELIAQGKKWNAVCDTVNAMGFRTRTKNKWDKSKKKIIGIIGDEPLNYKQLWRYLNNPIYCGVTKHKMLRIEDESGETVEHQPIFFKGEAIVSIELWNKANKGKFAIDVQDGKITIYEGKIPSRYTKKTKEDKRWPYKLYLRCHVCGRQIKASAPRGKLKSVPIYHCAGTNQDKHKYFGQNANQLHDEIETLIRHLEFSEEFIQKLRDKLLSRYESRREKAHQDSLNTSKQVQNIQDEQTLIIEKIKQTSSSVVLKALEEDYEKLEKDKAQAIVQRNEVEVEEVDVQTVINYFRYWMEHLEELLIDEDNPLISARLFSLCFEAPPTIPEIINGTPTLSPLFRLNEEYKKQKETQNGLSLPNGEPAGFRMEHLLDWFDRLKQVFDELDITPAPAYI